jgi:hypothetical protein
MMEASSAQIDQQWTHFLGIIRSTFSWTWRQLW